MGRKTKLTPEVEKRLLDAIDAGASLKHAAEYAGINPSTFFDWMKTKPDFANTIHAHDGKAAVGLMAIVRRDAEQEWKAATWILEHRWPEEYAQNRINVQHSGEVKVSIDLLAQLRAIVEQVFPDSLEAQERLADALATVEAEVVPALPRPRQMRTTKRERSG